ncbi:MAG: TrkH family potassium uptake protein [Rhodospirillales bacterium]|nr:TrkH family potassium uptake protein [Rhodospirillales bacterium]
MTFAQPILSAVSALLMILALTMTGPAFVDIVSGSPDMSVFPISAGLTLFAGGSLFFTNFSTHFKLMKRQAFLLVTLVWLILPLFGCLPFILGETGLSFTDAYFEAMSGITTTGSTVLTGLDHLSPGILIWRAILQWLGGLGIVVMSISILPILHVGGMQLFMVEAFETGDKNLPRARQISTGITLVFIGLTGICALALWLAGMTGVEALVHAMTTIATGGYSTSDGSIGHFHSATIEAIVTIGMIVGGTPFMLIFLSVQKRQTNLFRDTQVRCYLGILLLAISAICGWLWLVDGMSLPTALRYASFQAASIMTGTGFASTDYGGWSMPPLILLFFLTFVGGCAGSTACGIKVFRFQILFSICRMELRKILFPNGVFVPHYNNRPISKEVVMSILSFFFLLIFCFGLLTLALGLLGLDFVTAISSAATAISNVGPGLGPVVGPAGTFKDFPDAAKWLLAFGMLVGRLEVFTVMVLFSKLFWSDLTDGT